MADTLVIAVSQSGTTTDTNRTVDLARARGAAVIGIVNRRQSDLTDKADGVLYTSDGRDVEMSVASTKAFYAQVAAGALLACAITRGGRLRHATRSATRCWPGCGSCPARCARSSTLQPEIADAARRLAPSRRYWAVVGNGPNTVAAEEIRIKLSELCYKSIACDVTEDKKHIDLSSEPLILVCAAGLIGSTADDVAKEVAIFRAHKAAPVVIATEGEERFRAAPAVITVPAGRAGAGLRAGRHGRAPVRLRGRAGHRRPGPAAAGGPGGHRAGGRHGRARGRRAARRAAGGPGAAVPALRRRPAQRRLRRQPRGVDRGRAGRAAAGHRQRRAARVVPAGVGSGGHAGRPRRRPDRRAEPGHRGADPARSTPSSTRPRP